LASNEITVTAAGTYEVAFGMPINEDSTSGAARSRVFSWCQRDTGGGYTGIDQSWAQTYTREASGGSGLSTSFIVELTAGDKIRWRVQSQINTDISTETGQAQLNIKRLGA